MDEKTEAEEEEIEVQEDGREKLEIEIIDDSRTLITVKKNGEFESKEINGKSVGRKVKELIEEYEED